MKRLKLLWLSHLVPYPPQGMGALQRAYHLLRQVARYHDVHLLTLVQSQLMHQMFGDVSEGLAISERELSKFCVKVGFSPIPSEQTRWGKHWLAFNSLFRRHPYSVSWLQSDKMAGLVEDWCRETSFDVVHFDTIGLAPYLDMTGRTRKVLDHHNIESDMMIRRAKNATNIIKRAYYYQEGMRLRWYEKKVCPRFDVNITCSKLDSERLRGIVPNVEVAEVPNGVDIEYFSPRTATVKPHSLVFAGNMTWYPNQDAMRFFVELIWPLLKSRIPDVSMDIIGANSPERLSAYTDVDPRLRIHGFVKDVRPFLAESQVYICPIRDGGGTKLKILDALAMGKAIVAHPIACEGINVTSGRNIMFATSPAGFATAVQGLFEDPVRRSKMEISARELAVTEYSYESIGRKLAELYVGHVS